MEFSRSTASSWVNAISPGLAIGPPACSFKLPARPSQNCATFRLEFSTVGELMGPSCQLWPMEVFRLSLPPMDRLWQELQEMKPDLDRRGSNHSFIPSSTMAGLATVAATKGVMGSLLGCMAQLGVAAKPATIMAAATRGRSLFFMCGSRVLVVFECMTSLNPARHGYLLRLVVRLFGVYRVRHLELHALDPVQITI